MVPGYAETVDPNSRQGIYAAQMVRHFGYATRPETMRSTLAIWKSDGRSINGNEGCFDASVRNKARTHRPELTNVKSHYTIRRRKIELSEYDLDLASAPTRQFFIEYGCESQTYFGEGKMQLMPGSSGI